MPRAICIYTAIAALLTWRVALGGLEVRGYGETTMVLRVPVWWGYVPAVLCLAFLTLVCAYTVWRSLREARGHAVELRPMSGFMIGVLSFPIMLALLCLRIPIGVAMLLVGMVGYVIMSGWLPLINFLKSEPYSQFSGYSLSVIPLFLLMGQFATQAGMSRALFRAANVWLGHRRGGVAMAAVGGCAAFGAICGSSLATAATMAQVALPELRRYGYSGALATGTLAAGGTLGILIPPSVILVVYAILTEQNIAKLFVAAFVPGIIAALGYIAAIAVFVRIDPEAGPAGDQGEPGASAWRASPRSGR